MRCDFEAYLAMGDQNLTLDELFTMEDEAGIDVAVVMPRAEMEAKNRELSEIIKDNPRTIGCPLIDPHKGSEAVAELRTAIRVIYRVGIKIFKVYTSSPVYRNESFKLLP